MSHASTFRLLVAACDFGWGSIGKLRLILKELPDIEVTLFGSEEFGATVSRLLGPKVTFRSGRPGECHAALVINDPVAANQIAEYDLPVVYVDSLPYLWATRDEVPARQSIVHYCAQKYPRDRLALAGPLQDWANIRWIDPIVPHGRARHGGKGIVVNVGGLHSHMGEAAVDAYLTLVLFQLAEALKETGRRVHAICGNLDANARRRLTETFPACEAVGRQTASRFEQLLRHADLLISSPGSTTILQAIALRLPTLLLPPQNLSQILNARLYTEPSADLMQWPASVLDPAVIGRLRPQGEESALRYIYDAIDRAAGSVDAQAEVAHIIRTAVSNAQAGGVLSQGLAKLGANGARQVAQLIKQIRWAPIPPMSRPIGNTRS